MIVAASSNATNAALASLQADLSAAASDLFAAHVALVDGAGGLATGFGAASPARKALLFGIGCLRSDRRTCPRQGDSLYARTNFGLDAAVRHFVKAARVLTIESREALVPSHPDFRFVWDVGSADLYDGLARSTNLYYEEALARPAVASALQIATLPILAISVLLFLQRLFGPWVRRTLHESKVVAELLAQLPKEINVESMLLDALGMDAKKPSPGGVAEHAGAHGADRAHLSPKAGTGDAEVSSSPSLGPGGADGAALAGLGWGVGSGIVVGAGPSETTESPAAAGHGWGGGGGGGGKGSLFLPAVAEATVSDLPDKTDKS